MQISVGFEELNNVLGYSGIILGDKSVEEKMKNLIFMVSPDSVKMVAYNAYIFSRTTIPEAEIDIEGNKEWLFQVKAADVNKIMSSFSTLYRTKVTTVDFSVEGVKIKVSVHEEPKDGESERLAQVSSFSLESAPIIKKIEEEIKMAFPENGEGVTNDILLYLDTLFPLLSNDKASVMGSKLHFASDYVFVINGSMSAFMPNKLPDAFKDLSISYSSVNFLKKITEKGEVFTVAKTDKHLCVQEGNTDAFIRVQRVTPNYNVFLSKLNQDKGIVVDRLYLRDVLKRMSSMDPTGIVEVVTNGEGESDLVVRNGSFNQVIPLNKVRGIDSLKFSVSVPIWEKTILGRDDVFSGDLFIYFVETARGYIIFLKDSTGAWLSNTQVTKV